MVPRYNGKRRGFVLDESSSRSASAISRATSSSLDDRGDFVVRGDEVAARRRRIRLPSDSWLSDARCRIRVGADVGFARSGPEALDAVTRREQDGRGRVATKKVAAGARVKPPARIGRGIR
ncbi:hypothetical protein [Rhodococcus rhodnii]|uniref:hypothetical protein n=1 Tax=Rhodococcus rhodnii TaxID=38312 RepID=UPI0011C7C645|nr:hypothetical protein [Rhodococcus rhodnii]